MSFFRVLFFKFSRCVCVSLSLSPMSCFGSYYFPNIFFFLTRNRSGVSEDALREFSMMFR